MTRAEKIRNSDDAQLADLLCYLTDSKCESCRFGDNSEQCAAMKYLHQEVENEQID